VIGLVGPNGAGTIARVAFVAQDKPLYPSFTVAELLRLGDWLNPRFDRGRAEGRLTRLGIPMRQRAGKLSGGQRAQVALALALGKRPDLLLLDEPVANLDPLARHEFLQVLMAEVAETGLTVLLSSHLLADLERSCDYLVLLSASRVQPRRSDRATAGRAPAAYRPACARPGHCRRPQRGARQLHRPPGHPARRLNLRLTAFPSPAAPSGPAR
jgi:ABC-type Mn2+/Zn2+ transport system ATPase subunit